MLKQKAATKMKKHSLKSITQNNENKGMRKCRALSIETKLWIKNSLSSPIHSFIHFNFRILCHGWNRFKTHTQNFSFLLTSVSKAKL